jgi:2-dehydro-3-deoxy-D-arabinonate dehydratase
MQLIKFTTGDDPVPCVGLLDVHTVIPIGTGPQCLTELLHARDRIEQIESRCKAASRTYLLESVQLMAPLDAQEVWGAGVTYERSKVAREQESEQAATFYDRVYRALRPELFFKATPSRVAGPGRPIRVRHDSHWCVPEPELVLVLSPELEIVGFTIGNDVSARDIEGENPLYLPQAKVYDSCCSLGPAITLAAAMPARETIAIKMEVERDSAVVFQGETSIARMARRFEDLIEWLGRDNVFPAGVFLLTGTGVVPPDEFTLSAGDVVRITIDGIGSLVNPVVKS